MAVEAAGLGSWTGAVDVSSTGQRACGDTCVALVRASGRVHLKSRVGVYGLTRESLCFL
jgi:hypothetical protein